MYIIPKITVLYNPYVHTEWNITCKKSFFYMELRDKIPGMSFVKINIINILAKGIKLIILSEGIIKLQHSEAVVKNSQWHKWQYNHLGN